MLKLKPLGTTQEPGYPARWIAPRVTMNVLRRAAVAAAVSVALGLSGCGLVEGQDESLSAHGTIDQLVAADDVNLDEESSTADDGTMAADVLGMPLALGLEPGERASSDPNGGLPTTPGLGVLPIPPPVSAKPPSVTHFPTPLPVTPVAPPPMTQSPPKPPQIAPVIRHPNIRMAGVPRPVRLPGRRATNF